ncbi:MAG TPA: helical backbone metal receptor [Planctomycetota bacterium]|nr:helical backbone metal receptor [Planctomycetota bacterium]
MRRLAWILLLVGSCSKPPGSEPVTRSFADSRGKIVTVPWPPRRIVSILPSATELLFAVGAGEQVAGVTTYCDWPPEAKTKPKIGDIVVDYERLANLKPDLVVTFWSLTPKTGAEIEGKGYPVFSLESRSLEDIISSLRTVGALTGHETQAESCAATLVARVKAVSREPGPTFYFEHSAEPLGTAGPGTYTGDALRRAGGRNIFDDGWRLIDWESVMARDPEIILIAHDRNEDFEKRAGWSKLRAVIHKRVYFVAKEHYVYPTPRLADGLEEAARIFREKNP